MFATATHTTLADRFVWLINGLCTAIGTDARQRRMEAALAWAIWNRVRLLGDRLIALAKRAQAGRLPAGAVPPAGRAAGAGGGGRSAEPRPAAAPRAPRSRQAQFNAAASLPTASLPREFGWIRRMLPATAQYAGVLAYLLDDPELAALVEKAPQAGRILRPLCHLLGVKAPEFLRPHAGSGVAPLAEPEVPHAIGAPPTAEVPLEPPVAPAAAPVQATTAAPPARPPPQPSRSPAEEAALAYARRPGGLYWNGTGFRWS
jgi:hypothetical protein